VPNLLDPDFEPTDEELAQVMRGFSASVRARTRQALNGNTPKLSLPRPKALAWSLVLRASIRPWNVRRRLSRKLSPKKKPRP